MRRQKEVWVKEHETNLSIPSLAEKEPNSGVAYFVTFLKNQGIGKGNAVDLGCGKGRNSVFLAKSGFFVHALEYVQRALDETKLLAIKNHVQGEIHVLNAEIDLPWPFEKDFFDVAVDCFSSIDIETLQGREVFRDELFRTLKKGGYAFVSVVSVEDELEREMIRSSPGPEKNSVIWPETGKFQKDYDEKEIVDFYGLFKLIELKKVSKPSFRLGRKYLATNYWLILQKI